MGSSDQSYCRSCWTALALGTWWNMWVEACSPCRVGDHLQGTVCSWNPAWCLSSLLMITCPWSGGALGSACPDCCSCLRPACQIRSSEGPTCLKPRSLQCLLYFHRCSHKPHKNCRSCMGCKEPESLRSSRHSLHAVWRRRLRRTCRWTSLVGRGHSHLHTSCSSTWSLHKGREEEESHSGICQGTLSSLQGKRTPCTVIGEGGGAPYCRTCPHLGSSPPW